MHKYTTYTVYTHIKQMDFCIKRGRVELFKKRGKL